MARMGITPTTDNSSIHMTLLELPGAPVVVARPLSQLECCRLL